MNRLKYIILMSLMVIGMTNCTKDLLDVNPKGILTDDQLSSADNIEGFVISAYSYIPSLWYWDTLNSWPHGSVRSDDAYKGGGSLTDQTPWYQMEVFTLTTPTIGNIDGPWYKGYCGISRCAAALRALKNVDESEFPLKEQRIAEMRFLRGWIYFKLKLLFRWIPWFHEDVPSTEYGLYSNHPEGMTSDLELWQKIYDDFKAAAEVLPAEQEEKGRPTKYAAEGFLVKTLLWMAYEQDENNRLTNINTERLNEALEYCDDIIESGKYDLCPDFAENFLPEYDNNTPESLWEIQYSIDDGTENGRVNWGDQLNAPWWTPYFNCCDFHKPSYNLVNAFKTDESGLPLFDTFNNEEIDNAHSYFARNTWDPRFSHTVAAPGYPWKYDTNLLYDSVGSRKPEIYGYFNSLKENVSPNCGCLYKPFYVQNSMNKREIRYDEVLLWKAEILIQTGRHMEALPLINEIRSRAANSTGRLKFALGIPLLNYKVGLYIDGVNCTWDDDFAFKALVWENRLEMACEGRRFFDLIRWGIAEEVMNAYFEKEKTRYDWLKDGHFTSGRDEYLPIPQAQMNWSQGVYKQNVGY
jgi:hypothetical protein